MNQTLSLAELQATLKQHSKLPEDMAQANPPQIYTSPEWLEKEIDEIFNHEWFCVGREDEFKENGTYRTTKIGRDPVIILRDQKGVLRAMSNICRHQMVTLLEGSGQLNNRIVCPYHGWNYAQDGQLIGASFMPDNFDKKACRLPQFQIEVWNGWVYVCLDPNAEPLAPRLTDISEGYANYRMSEYKTLFRAHEVWNTNWKIAVQNFMEGYHLFAVHKHTIEPVMPTRLANVMGGGEAYGLYEQGRIPGQSYEHNSPLEPVNTHLTDKEKNTAVLFAVYPCHVTSVSAERTFWLSLQPLGTDKVSVYWGADIFPGTISEDESVVKAYAQELKKGFDAINEEDKPIIGSILENASATAAKSGHLSTKEKTVLNFQKYLARKICE